MKTPTKELTSKDSNVTKFNHNLSLLLLQLSKIYPDDYDLKKWSDKFEWGKRFNAKLACTLFVNIISDYAEEIMEKNEHFFLEQIDYHGKIDNPEYLSLIRKVINLWSESDNQKLKDNIWRYFQTLLTYGALVVKDQSLVDRINNYRPADNQLSL